MDELITIMAGQSEEVLRERIELACDIMEKNYAADCYSKIRVLRHWSKHNPTISGEIARPSAYRWYLRREMFKLASCGAEIFVDRSRRRVDLNSPKLLELIDESDFDITRKKVFLFGPERADLSIQRLEHYTGTKAEDFQRHVLLTNYQMHMDAFEYDFPSCTKPRRADVQMPAYHSKQGDNNGITIVNIGVGPLQCQEPDRPSGGVAARCDVDGGALRGCS